MENYLRVVKESEQDLIRELVPARLEALDEEELLALHRRVRRARNKHTKNYHRKAAASVAEEAGRGAAHPKGGKSRHRAEALEEALSIVSARLAAVAHQEAERLKAERLAMAQANRNTGPDGAGDAVSGAGVGAGIAREHSKTAGGIKRDGSSASQGAQRQAKRDR